MSDREATGAVNGISDGGATCEQLSNGGRRATCEPHILQPQSMEHLKEQPHAENYPLQEPMYWSYENLRFGSSDSH